MISKKRLTRIIQEKFPKMRKPMDYANVILAGLKLKALDKQSARKHKDFSKIAKIKDHVFGNCHNNLDLLVKVEKGDRGSPSPVSERELIVFKFDRAQIILDYEKSLLIKHIKDNEKVRKITTDALKIPVDSSINTLENILDEGDIFKQGSKYEKIFNSIADNKIKPMGYMMFGIRLIPKPTYYLSRKAIDLTNNKSKGVNR